jgi:hypothetical protein
MQYVMNGHRLGTTLCHWTLALCVGASLVATTGCRGSEFDRDIADIGAALAGKEATKSSNAVVQGRLVALDAGGSPRRDLTGEVLIAFAEQSRACHNPADCANRTWLSQIGQKRCALETANGTVEIASPILGLWTTSNEVLKRFRSKEVATKITLPSMSNVYVLKHDQPALILADPGSVKGEQTHAFRAGDSVAVYGNVQQSESTRVVRGAEIISGPLDPFNKKR